MSKVIKLKRGLDIGLVGEAVRKIKEMPVAETYAVCPGDYHGIVPKLLVKVGDAVKAGSPLFFDKAHPNVLFTSPVSGKIKVIKRGDKRRILSVVVEADVRQEYLKFQAPVPEKSTREKLVESLLSSGLWTLIIERPYGVIADPDAVPDAIFVSGFDSSPLAPDMNFVLENEYDNLAAGFEVLKKLTDGKVHLGLKAGSTGVLNRVTGVEQTQFQGPHPAGNVGVQIHHVRPIGKGDIIWTVDVQNVALIGRFFRTGELNMRKTIAVAGSEVVEPQYISIITGAPMIQVAMAAGIKRQSGRNSFRLINGNVLTGTRTDGDGYVNVYQNQVTVIPEGDKYEFVGWIKPRLDRFSVSRSYFSWLFPRKKYELDTNLNGGERAFVLSDIYDRYLPMDIYALYLIKACMAGDIDKMENLGIYEVLPEDLALCEFVDPSKTDIQQIIQSGIDLMIKELS